MGRRSSAEYTVLEARTEEVHKPKNVLSVIIYTDCCPPDSAECKQRFYRHFLTTIIDVDVRSTDGLKTMTESKHRSKKPGQVKRKGAAKTTSEKVNKQ
ncbi:hypothetical protein RRG08_047148 [Elysia crispata]|uniref:Uncharacterized protein n=1 Tax=Elysia crispata TaxID=231223 RepID=A0AAE0YNE6_9GAST|nr:hypothetical protein RRG08_047148 [Elysia crispata]